MHRSRVAILSGTLLAAVVLLLPFVSTPLLGGINGIEGAAWPAVAILGVPALLALAGDRREGFHVLLALVAIVAAALATLFAVAKVIDAVQAARDIRLVVGEASVGLGTWLLPVAALVALMGSVMTLSTRVG